MSSTLPCTFCGRSVADALGLGTTGNHSCPACARRLGSLMREGALLAPIWPVLAEEDDDGDGPEPRVKFQDGTSVEVRQRTAELKRELSSEQRAELAHMLLEHRMEREALLELSWVLMSGELGPVQRALTLLFLDALTDDGALERLRPFLLPV